MNVLRVPIRQILAKGIRNYAAAVTHGGATHVEHHHEKEFKIPVATYDDIPVPRYPYKEMYDKENSKFNLLLAGAAIIFLFTTVYTIYDDTFFIEAGLPPKSYRNRKIYKPTDP